MSSIKHFEINHAQWQPRKGPVPCAAETTLQPTLQRLHWATDMAARMSEGKGRAYEYQHVYIPLKERATIAYLPSIALRQDGFVTKEDFDSGLLLLKPMARIGAILVRYGLYPTDQAQPNEQLPTEPLEAILAAA